VLETIVRDRLRVVIKPKTRTINADAINTAPETVMTAPSDVWPGWPLIACRGKPLTCAPMPTNSARQDARFVAAESVGTVQAPVVQDGHHDEHTAVRVKGS
jgi:hypothetical protein